jgi:phosphoribosylamine--glycine ligase
VSQYRLLVIGQGAREHALIKKLACSPLVETIYAAPGNGGTASTAKTTNIAIPLDTLCDFAIEKEIDLTIVGPEAPLAQGIVDLFQSKGKKIIGPTQKAAQLESSKAFAKSFMTRHGIPTAPFAVFEEPLRAHVYIDAMAAPCVIKADGLAAGKGVVVASNPKEAHEAVDAMLVQKKYGSAGEKIIIERRLHGTEMSFMVLAKGEHFVPLATSRDYKRLLEGDQGPNTGGMGAYSPHESLTDDLLRVILTEIIEPSLAGAAKDGMPYEGFLYVGLMITEDNYPFVLEYNCRLGDPETCPILMRLQDDIFEVLWAMAENRMPLTLNWDNRHAVGVVLAAAGYPEAPELGQQLVYPPQESDDVLFFHAGTTLQDNHLYVSGGRIGCVTALGETRDAARQKAYDAIIPNPGVIFRKDIGA